MFSLHLLPGRDTHWAGPHRWPYSDKAWIHRDSRYPGINCLGIQEGSGRNRRGLCRCKGLHSGTGQRLLCLGEKDKQGEMKLKWAGRGFRDSRSRAERPLPWEPLVLLGGNPRGHKEKVTPDTEEVRTSGFSAYLFCQNMGKIS